MADTLLATTMVGSYPRPRWFEPQRVTLTTDCGMKQLPRAVAAAKLRSLVDGAAIVRAELEGTR